MEKVTQFTKCDYPDSWNKSIHIEGLSVRVNSLKTSVTSGCCLTQGQRQKSSWRPNYSTFVPRALLLCWWLLSFTALHRVHGGGCSEWEESSQRQITVGPCWVGSACPGLWGGLERASLEECLSNYPESELNCVCLGFWRARAEGQIFYNKHVRKPLLSWVIRIKKKKRQEGRNKCLNRLSSHSELK